MRPAILALCVPLMGSAAPSYVVAPAGPPSRPPVKAVIMPARFRPYLEYECRSHGVPLWIAAALIDRESGWRPRAVGLNADGTRDYGLMQLNSAYLSEFSWRYRGGLPYDPFDPFDCMAIGVEHLAALRARVPTWRDALTAYNCGLARFLLGRAPKASMDYADSIMGGGK